MSLVHKTRVWARQYRVHALDTKREKVLDGVDKTKSQLARECSGLVEGSPRSHHLDGLFRRYETSSGHEQDLLALTVYFMNSKPRWRGRRHTWWKLFKAGDRHLDNIFNKEFDANCIDAAAFYKDVAGEFGIEGKIETIWLSNPVAHRYFRTDEGAVADTMIRDGLQKFGVFSSVEAYKETLKPTQAEFMLPDGSSVEVEERQLGRTTRLTRDSNGEIRYNESQQSRKHLDI